MIPRRLLPAARRGAFVLLSALALSGCLEERLQVQVFTRIQPDGACERRIEYLLEHVDDQTGERRPLDPARDSLRRLHRFPSGEAWRVRDEVAADRHLVVAEALLPSPNDVGSDYQRAPAPREAPATNTLSYDCAELETAGAVCDYAELFLDPASPPAVVRRVLGFLAGREDAFARGVSRALRPASPSTASLRAAYRERFVAPLVARAEALATRRFFGPRERADLDALLEEGGTRTEDLVVAVSALTPGAGADRVREAVEAEIERQVERFTSETPSAGELLGGDTARRLLQFRATVVMPGPILRANTCFGGDTASWEFTGEDLYLQGFDLRARAAAPGGR
jgi:hypothetical protein